MELLIAFLIAFGFASPADYDSLSKDKSKVDKIYQASGATQSQLDSYRKKIIEIEQDGM